MPENWKWELQCFHQGYGCIAGLDEVGMGCLAGPVVAAAVILDPENVPEGIRDSKLLSPKRRAFLDEKIRASARAFQIAVATVEEIDSINIYQAARLAMKRAVEGLNLQPDYLLVDGRARVDLSIQQVSLIGGDGISASIGAASIIAKVFRDNLMEGFEKTYPGYGFARHKGYGSVFHRQALGKMGPTTIHRKSFSWTPV